MSVDVPVEVGPPFARQDAVGHGGLAALAWPDEKDHLRRQILRISFFEYEPAGKTFLCRFEIIPKSFIRSEDWHACRHRFEYDLIQTASRSQID